MPVLDVIQGRPNFELLDWPDAGALYLWHGGPGLAGEITQDALLVSADPMEDDNLGWGVRAADVTGDGILDVLGPRPQEVGGSVWIGGPQLDGIEIAGVTLPAGGQDLVDLTGDGILDIVARSFFSSSEVFVYAGGPALAGHPPLPLAELSTNRPFVYAEVTGDGVLDVLVGDPQREVDGLAEAGAVLMWQGGKSLIGFLEPQELMAAGPVAGDRLGEQLLLIDLSGDGILDAVSAAPLRDLGGVLDVGQILGWTFDSPLPAATFEVSGARANDRLEEISGPLD